MACCAAASLCACADTPRIEALGPPPIDATSPVARQVAEASAGHADYPRFTQIPLAPTDIRPARAWTRSIYDTLRLRRQLLVEAAVAGPPRTDTEAFSKSVHDRATAPTSPSAVAAQAQTDQTGAFAAGVRERATPPSSAR